MDRYVTLQRNPALVSNGYVPTFNRQVAVTNWQHRIGAGIGFDTASFTVEGDKLLLEELYGLILGAGITRYALNGNDIIWEGFVNKLTLRMAGLAFSVSLDNLYNRVRVRYTPLDTSSTPPAVTAVTTRTTAVGDTPSQSRYGIKDLVLTAGETTSTIANQITAAALAEYKQPRRSAELGPSNDISLVVECLGYGHTLNWQIYNQTGSSGTQAANLEVAAIISSAGQFIARTVISTNSVAIARYTDFDRTALEQLRAIAEQGSSSNTRWLIQVLEGRTLYYKEASTTVAYNRRIAEPNREIYKPGGAIVPYELVRPDNWLRVSDSALAETGGIGKPGSANALDPQLIYIETVSYSEPDNLQIAGSLGDSTQAMLARQSAQGARLI